MAKRTWFSAAAGANGTADIAIYEDIGGFGVHAGDFRDALDAIGPVSTINLRLNSIGGDVFQGIAIHNMLARHPATVNVTVDGAAMSIASFVAMAGDTITMPENATMFVHNPFGSVEEGDAADMAEMSGWLSKLGESMATTYARRTGHTQDEMLALMNANTWMTASEAKANGFADVVAPPAKIAARFDLSRHPNAPPGIAAAAPQAAYDPDGDGDDDVLEALGYIGKAVDSLADAVGALTGTGEGDDVEAPPAMAAVASKAYAAMLRCANLASQVRAREIVPVGTPVAVAEAQAVPALAESGAPRSGHAEEIASLCVIAGFPERTLGFLQSAKSPKEVRSELQALRADRGRDPGDDISARHAVSDIDVAAAGWGKTLDRINSRIVTRSS